jgi:hypothetical protein
MKQPRSRLPRRALPGSSPVKGPSYLDGCVFKVPNALIFVLAYACCLLGIRGADANHCAICSTPFGLTIYTVMDKVKHEKLFVCYDCAICPDECYLCGLPVRADGTKLPDGRVLCSRDVKTAILDAGKAQQICEEIRDTLDRKFSRFLTLPSTNVAMALADRVDLNDELAVVGNNFECPDILGYIHSRTNEGGLFHTISLMSALPLPEFQATCAHEYAHAWVFENVSSQRRKTLSRDAHEGFCELVAYLLMESLNQEEQMKKMLRNSYTRGQINLFIATEKEYGFNDTLDWMRWGVNPRLKAADLGAVRNVEMPHPKAGSSANALVYAQPPPPGPPRLVLKGISSAKNQPLALINDQTFAVGESAKVRVGTSNVLVRCLAIGTRSARVELLSSGTITELQLSERTTQ